MSRYIESQDLVEEEIQEDQDPMYKSVTPIPECDSQEFKSYPAELAAYISQNGGARKILTEQAVKRHLDELKVIMFIQKLEEDGASAIEKNQELSSLLKSASRSDYSNADRSISLEEAIRLVK